MKTTLVQLEVSEIGLNHVDIEVQLFDGTIKQLRLLEGDFFSVFAEVALFDPRIKIRGVPYETKINRRN